MNKGVENGLLRDGHEVYTRRRGRNVAIGGCLGGVVLMIFAVTIVKLSSGVDMRGFDHTFETVPAAPGTETEAGQ